MTDQIFELCLPFSLFAKRTAGLCCPLAALLRPNSTQIFCSIIMRSCHQDGPVLQELSFFFRFAGFVLSSQPLIVITAAASWWSVPDWSLDAERLMVPTKLFNMSSCPNLSLSASCRFFSLIYSTWCFLSAHFKCHQLVFFPAAMSVNFCIPGKIPKGQSKTLHRTNRCKPAVIFETAIRLFAEAAEISSFERDTKLNADHQWTWKVVLY